MPIGPTPSETTITEYRLIIGGVTAFTFAEVQDLGTKTEVVVSTVTVDGKPEIRKVPGRFVVHNVVLTRALTQDLELSIWRGKIEDGQISLNRKSGAISAVNALGKEVARWSFTNAWPSKLVTNIPAGTEQVTLAAERLLRSR